MEYSMNKRFCDSAGKPLRRWPGGGIGQKPEPAGAKTGGFLAGTNYVVASMIRPDCHQPKRQTLGGIRTRQENVPFHGALLNLGKCRPVDGWNVLNMQYISDMTGTDSPKPLPARVLDRIEATPGKVWTPGDFADVGPRGAIDKALQRMVRSGELRRVKRGLYDRPTVNRLTGKPTVPDYRAVIEAVARRDKVRFVVDGMTAANTLGLTNAVPAKIGILVDARLKPIELGNRKIVFRQAAPSRLYWAGRPGMYIVQALHWIHDAMQSESERSRTDRTIRELLTDGRDGKRLAADLKTGLSAMPIWMQDMLRHPLASADAGT